MKGDPLQDIDPRAKLFFALTVTVLALLIPQIEYLVGLLLITFFIVLLGGILKSWFSYLSALKMLIPILFFLNLFFYAHGKVIRNFDLSLFTLSITYGGLRTSIMILLRLFSIAAVGAMFAVSTEPETFEIVLGKLKVPWRLAFVSSLTLKLVPEMKRRYKKIEEAQVSRGLKLKGGPIKRIRSRVPILIPFFVSIIRYGYELTEALEARGFDDIDERTNLISLEHGPYDYLLYLISIAIFLVYIFLNFFIGF